MADTPGTPESLRVSDAERDRAVEELRKQFADGRLSHDTFLMRMNNALGARNRGQLTGLFDDLPAHRGVIARAADALSTWASRFRGAAAGRRTGDWPEGDWPAPAYPAPAYPVSATAQPVPPARTPAAPVPPAPLLFPRDMGTTFTIGRHQGCDLYIADMSVSRLHARLARDAQGWLLTDLGSTNGTRLNGWRVRQTVPVRAGDQVRFGSVDFVLQPGPPPDLPDLPDLRDPPDPVIAVELTSQGTPPPGEGPADPG